MILDYCRELFGTLEHLEELIKASEMLREEYQQRITKQIEHQATVLNILISIAIIVYFMPERMIFFSNIVPESDPLELFFRMSAITFISLILGYGLRLGLTWLWKYNYLPAGRKHIAYFLRKKYLKKQNEIIKQIQEILTSQMIEEAKIPSNYMNTKSLNYIIGCLEAGEVATLGEAIDLLELESRDIQVHYLIKSENDTLAKAWSLVKNNENEEERG